MTDCYLQLCPQNSHRGRQDQGRKCETMSLISFSSLIIVISSVQLPYSSTATNWRLHATDKEMSQDESVSVGQTDFFNFWNGFSYLYNLKRLNFNDFIDGTKVLWESGDEVLCYAVHPFTTDIIVTSNMYHGNTIKDIEDFIVSDLGVKICDNYGFDKENFHWIIIVKHHTNHWWQCNGMNINFLLIKTIA